MGPLQYVYLFWESLQIDTTFLPWPAYGGQRLTLGVIAPVPPYGCLESNSDYQNWQQVPFTC